MESVSESIKNTTEKSEGFLKYMINFDEQQKGELLNMLQYTVLCIIPIIVILKIIKNYVPEENDDKGSLEIFAEVVAQILFIITSIWFINHLIRYLSPYSGVSYHKFNETNFILAFMLILITMQTKLGAKINILVDRVMDLWNGRQESNDHKNVNTNVKITQPLANIHQPSQADHLDNNMMPPPPIATKDDNNGTTSLSQLQPMSQMPPTNQQPQIAPQQSPDFNQMYQNNPTPLVDAEPMAANESMGNMFGSSW